MFFGFRQAVAEGLVGRPAVHVPAMVSALVVVVLEVFVEVVLHLLDRIVPLLPAQYAEVLVKKRSVEPFHKAVRLRPLDLGGPVLYALDLQEDLAWVAVWTAAVFPTVVREHGRYNGLVHFKERQSVLIEDMDGGHRELGRVQSPPCVARVAVYDRL